MIQLLSNSFYKKAELFCLFILLPIMLATDLGVVFKIGIALVGIAYCVWLSWKLGLINKTDFLGFPFKHHLKRLLITFSIIVISTSIFMLFLHPEDLFLVVVKQPLLWVAILLFYSIFSVLPQELLYRSFFFNRYTGLFSNHRVLMGINVFVFPVAHLLFHNYLVLVVTLIGGILFTVTYNRSKSLLFTSMEHALYGNWLFTIGMGEMLAFPMPQY
ncbi:MAG: CPBP family glutamic-type intramembrane protease [Reichenbachiella sp.]